MFNHRIKHFLPNKYKTIFNTNKFAKKNKKKKKQVNKLHIIKNTLKYYLKNSPAL